MANTRFSSGELVTAAKLNTVNPSIIATGGTIARTLADRFIDVVNVKDFGATADGSTDDTAAVQAAIDNTGMIFFPAGTYKIEGTITLPSDVIIQGEPGTILKGIVTAEGGGVYPNQMFTATSKSDISFRNVKFDFSRGSNDYASGAGLSSINSLKFTSTTDVSFLDCELTAFVTNQNTSYIETKNYINFAVASFDACKRVYFQRLLTSDIREEGPAFYDCEQVYFDGWNGDGTVSGTGNGTSSHASFWYCDGVSVRDADFKHMGGSVLNCFARNVVYENVNVNDGGTQDGRGFDFGNELNVKTFDAGNISVQNCSLNVDQYGVFTASSTFNDVIESIKVDNCRFTVGVDVTAYGVFLRYATNAVVSNCYISLGDVSSETGAGVFYVASGTGPQIEISNNHIIGNTGVFTQFASTTTVNGVYVLNNNFVSQASMGGTAANGGSTFFQFWSTQTSGTASVAKNIQIIGNRAEGIEGAYVNFNLTDATLFRLEDIKILRNSFEGDPTYSPVAPLTANNGIKIISGKNGDVTAFADYSGTVAGTVKATSVGHGLTTGTEIAIAGPSTYNGTFTITSIDADNFYFTDTWGSTSTGSYFKTSEPRRVWITGNEFTEFQANYVFYSNYLYAGENVYRIISTNTGIERLSLDTCTGVLIYRSNYAYQVDGSSEDVDNVGGSSAFDLVDIRNNFTAGIATDGSFPLGTFNVDSSLGNTAVQSDGNF